MRTDDARPCLDHVFLTADGPTLQALRGNPDIVGERLGRFRTKKAISTLMGPYETLNIAARNTFVEFFPQEAPPFPGVKVGLVMSFERVGSSARAARALADAGIACHQELVRRQVEGEAEPQPWYNLIRPDFGAGSPFTLFLSEITPEYFDRLGAERTADGRQAREAYLQAAIRAPHAPGHMFEDLSRVVLRLVPSRVEMFQRVLTVLGYVRSQLDPNEFEGPRGCAVGMSTCEPDDEGLAELHIALNRGRSEASTHRLGASSLHIPSSDGHSARWCFNQ